MRAIRFFCVCLTLFLPVGQVIACALPLENFGKTYCLSEHPDGGYQVSGMDLRLALSNRIIVRASGLNRDTVKALDARIQSVSELYLLADSTYYLVTLAVADELARVMNKLRSEIQISLVQPDVLQLRQKHSHPEQHPIQSPVVQSLSVKPSAQYFQQLGIMSLWQDTDGSGVNVAIVDDGFAIDHPEFASTHLTFSYDVESHTQNVSPRSENDSHGTRVTGVIFAAHDGKGIDGIAPAAGLIALRQPDTWTSQTLLSFYLSKLSHADIINASWGSPWLLEPMADIVDDLAQNGRSGKGVAVVFSAGNSGLELVDDNASARTEAQIASAVVIGSDDGHGKRTRFSNYGKTVDAYVYGKPVAAVTPQGYGRFSGTSLSAAVVSGYFALLLSRDPSLTLDQLVAALKRQLETDQEAL